MATSCVLYSHEKTSYLLTATEPLQDSRPHAPQPTLTLNTHGQAAVQDSANVARNLPTEEALCLEIEKLCTETLTINKAFCDIGRKLSHATREQNKRASLYDICWTLETKWKEHHETFKSLLWRSRELAGEAQGAVDDFCEVVLPSLKERDKTKSEKQEVIQAQMKILQDTSQSSQDLSQEFLDFGESLDGYIAEFSEVVDGFEMDEQAKKVDGLEDRLRSARGPMEAVSKEVKEVGCKLATDVAIVGVTVLLAFVAPRLWAQLASAAAVTVDLTNVKRSGFQFLEARRQCDFVQVAVAEYEAIRDEYHLERTCLGQMMKLESALCDSRPLVQEVTTKLGIFANVWAAITADIRKLRNSLKYAEDSGSQLFIRRIERLERMYGYLSQALRHYQVTVWLPE